MVPEAAKNGKSIAIISERKCLVILRPRDELYYIIGEPYIDEFMDGEFMEVKERGEYKEVS